MDKECYRIVNDKTANLSHLDTKARKNVEKFRKQLDKSHDTPTV